MSFIGSPPLTVINGAWTAHAPYVTAHIFETYLEQPSHLLHASPWSPSYWKRNSCCGQRGTGGRHLRLVCASRMDALPCAFLALSLSTFQPIFRGVGALSVIALKPTQPLVLFSCQQSRLTQDPDSRMFLSTLRQILFYFATAKLPHLFSSVRASCITTANGSVCPRLFTA